MTGPDRATDDGMTLIELVVALAVSAVVLVAVTVGLIPVYRLTVAAEGAGETQGQLSTAMLRLDRQVRYAVTMTATADGRSVRYLAVRAGAERVCRALRWQPTADGTGVVQERSWPVGGTPDPVWGTIASRLRIDRPGYTLPFQVVPPADDVAYQRLRVRLVAVATGGVAERPSDVTFTALNWRAEVTNPC